MVVPPGKKSRSLTTCAKGLVALDLDRSWAGSFYLTGVALQGAGCALCDQRAAAGMRVLFSDAQRSPSSQDRDAPAALPGTRGSSWHGRAGPPRSSRRIRQTGKGAESKAALAQARHPG